MPDTPEIELDASGATEVLDIEEPAVDNQQMVEIPVGGIAVEDLPATEEEEAHRADGEDPAAEEAVPEDPAAGPPAWYNGLDDEGRAAVDVMRESERSSAARATAFQHRMSQMAGDRRESIAAYDALQKRFEPLEQDVKERGEARQALSDQAALPKDPAELFAHNMHQANVVEQEKTRGVVAALEQKMEPVFNLVNASAERDRYQAQVQYQATQLADRCRAEDGSCSPETWAAVQKFETTRAHHYEREVDPRTGQLYTTGEQGTARVKAQEDRMLIYTQHYAAQYSHQADPSTTGPMALAHKLAAWGGGDPPNGNGRPAPALPAAVAHHRALQRAEPTPPAPLGAAVETGSPVDQIARAMFAGTLDEGERMADLADQAVAIYKKKNPGFTFEMLAKMVTARVEQLGSRT